MSELVIRNRQRTRKIDLLLLRKIVLSLLKENLHEADFQLGIHLISAKEMTTVNQTFLQHEGSTDVITFDYSESEKLSPLHGEIFICIDDAVKQAKEFETIWQAELVRYIAHGILHLQGFDDLQPALLRKMKREENRLVHELSQSFPIKKLHRRTAG